MIDKRVRHLPVVEVTKVTGIVSIGTAGSRAIADCAATARPGGLRFDDELCARRPWRARDAMLAQRMAELMHAEQFPISG